MIRLLQHSEIDRDRWDELIRRSPEGRIYAESWLLDRVSPGWHALVRGDYEAVFPLCWRSKYGLHYLYQPAFCQQLGLFSREEPPFLDVSEFLEAIPRRYGLIEIQLNSGNRCTHPAFTVRERPNLELRLQRSYEDLKKVYAENTRRNLRKAETSGVLVREADSIEPIIRLFRENRGAGLEKLTEQHYGQLRSVAEYALRHGRGFLRVANDPQETTQAGAFFLRSEERIIFLFSGTSTTARKTGAMTMLIDTVIREFSGSKLRLDFEGSVDPKLARFYAGFGSEEVVYLQIRRNRLPFPFRLFKS
jgi:hypothetical protein